jgi:hypothetical protein
MSRFAGVALSLGAVAVLAAGIVGCTDAVGYYRSAAEAECRTRGVDPQGTTFAACVQAVESAEYRRWSRGAPGH